MRAIKTSRGKPINTNQIFTGFSYCAMVSFSNFFFFSNTSLSLSLVLFLHPLFSRSFLFLTFRNSIAASAVCAFNLSAISQVFKGPFKYQENSRSAWLPYPNPNPDFQVTKQYRRQLADANTNILTCSKWQYAV